MKRFFCRKKRAVLLLIAFPLALGIGGCGGSDDGSGVTLMLDFTPNANHAGIYVAEHEGFYEKEGIDLTIRQPGESTDAPKLLGANQVDFAVLDIHDLGIARENGLDVVGVMGLVQTPLAAVIGLRSKGVFKPRDLEGRTVGVTGLPSDEAVVDSVVAANGGDPAKVHRVTIGFNAVSALASEKVDAVTGFWNAEGIVLHHRGIPIRIFRVSFYGDAPRYPELVLAASRETIEQDPKLVDAMAAATAHGYRLAVKDRFRALDDLIAEVPSLDRQEQGEELHAVVSDIYPAPFVPVAMKQWAAWDLKYGILKRPIDVHKAFRLKQRLNG
jgi:putative hydroxymethylpyrimidine transport system substrate-binding protein